MSTEQNIPRDIYPFATQDGQAIPLDIMKPKGVYVAYVTPEVMEYNFTRRSDVVSLHADVPILVYFGAEPAGFDLPDTLYCPANSVLVVALPNGITSFQAKTFSEEPISGRLIIQFMERWAGLSLPRQWQKK